MPRNLCLLLLFALAVTVTVIAFPIIPLGVVSTDDQQQPVVEWVWSRHQLPDSIAETVNRLIWPLFPAGCLSILSVFGIRKIASASVPAKCSYYALLLVFSAQWLWAVQQAAATPHRQLKPLWVLYDPGASGYFFEAVFRMDSPARFLSQYEAKMKEGDVLHIGTHPPGMFLLAKGCIELCETDSIWSSVANSLIPDSTDEAFEFVEQNARLHRPLTQQERSGLKLLAVFTFTLMVAAVIPLAVLTARVFGPKSAWLICCLYPTAPSLAIFYPKSDVLFPFLSTLLLLSAVVGSHSKRNAMIIAVPAGLLLLFSATLSLAILPTLFAIALMLGFRVWQNRQQALWPTTILISLVTLTIVSAAVAIDTIYDCNLFVVFQSNLSNHAGFYDQFTRTWWKWFLVNPIELAFSVGLPVVAAAIWSAIVLRSPSSTDKVNAADLHQDCDERSQASALRISLAFTMALLWVSGKNNGEAARLWCFLVPWVLIVIGPWLGRLLKEGSLQKPGLVVRWLMVIQLIACIITVGRVSGFSF